ncbi:type II toxin-antitoxin system Phd/YefM family antitoxin [Lactobacillus johnsonii]|uniref:type II toxin-antitoxin system Phd/YefM family antitoxin n=1 Tax=Lactobacillus johnsonii TaxID=33959 RepID=UPI001433911D|nr:type II toxin-antitoxin system Phd/YefM family antitoxin [Lactobacillus johnsonii]GFI21237.1 antitoxin RelF [Lactobacillus johnsonii]
MMENLVYNPTNARKDLYRILKEVNDTHTPVTIQSQGKNSDAAVLVGAEDWRAIQETLFLAQHGVDKVIKERELDNSGWTDVEDIDWDQL